MKINYPLFFFFALFLISNSFAFYYPLNLQSPSDQFASGWFDNTSTVNVCPCMHTSIPLVISNPTSNPISVYTNFDSLNSSLSGYISPSIDINAQSSSIANVQLTTQCTTSPGPAYFSVQLFSNDSQAGYNSQIQQLGSVNVVACSSLQLISDSASFTCPISQTNYYYTLYNSGTNPQFINLQTLGVKGNFISVYPSSLVLNSGQSQTITVVFSPPATYQSNPTDSFTLNAVGNLSSSSVSSPLKSANCAYIDSLNSSNQYLPSNISNNSFSAPVSSGNSGNSQIASIVSGFFFRLTSPTSYIELFVILVIILILLYLNSTQKSNEQEPQNNQSNSRLRALKIAHAVDKY